MAHKSGTKEELIRKWRNEQREALRRKVRVVGSSDQGGSVQWEVDEEKEVRVDSVKV